MDLSFFFFFFFLLLPPLLLLFWKWTLDIRPPFYTKCWTASKDLLIIFPRGLPAAPSSEPMGQAILSGRCSQLARNGHVRRRNHLGYSIFFSISFSFFSLLLPSSRSSACLEEPTINYISKHFSDPLSPLPSHELMDFTEEEKRNLSSQDHVPLFLSLSLSI